jgi:thioredoxin reductase (NADPH)
VIDIRWGDLKPFRKTLPPAEPSTGRRNGGIISEMTIRDCLVVGAGPAGLSAAIYAARLNRSVLVLDDGSGRSTTHEVNENYLGFPDGVKSRELRRLGKLQAERFGAEFERECVTQLERGEDGGFLASADGKRFLGRTVILATGVNDNFPEFPDTQDYVGRSLFWCIICDGHKAVGKRVVVAGRGEDAAVTCLQMLNFTNRLVFVEERAAGTPVSERRLGLLRNAGADVVQGRIVKLEGKNGLVRTALLDGGKRLEADVVFSIQKAEPKNVLARQLGVSLSTSGYVSVDLEQRTNLPMVYAAGDLTRPFAHQIVSAAHEGATAAQTANYDLYRPEQKED